MAKKQQPAVEVDAPAGVVVSFEPVGPVDFAAANDAWNAATPEKRARGVAACGKDGHADPVFGGPGPFCPRCATFL